MFRISALVTGIVFVAVSGIVHGILTDRWALSPQPQAAAAKLANVPLRVGDWEGQDGPPIRAQEIVIGELAGYISRQYENRLSGIRLDVLVVCGRPGPIAVHTPDVCLLGEGFNLVRRQKMPLPSNPADQFVVAHFRKLVGEGAFDRRVFWSWSATGAWDTPDSPRWTFAGKPFLYKLYVTRALLNVEEKPEEDPVWEFLKVFMPEVQTTLFREG
jgi:hypothetical protein